MTEAQFQARRIKALSAPKGRKKREAKSLVRLRTKMLKAEMARG